MFEIGQDHYYRDPEIDLKALALACLVLEQLAKTTSNRPESQFKKIPSRAVLFASIGARESIPTDEGLVKKDYPA